MHIQAFHSRLFCIVFVHQIWMQPEGKQLCTPFNRLKKLSIHGIYMEFDLLWTLNLLEAAPSVEMFGVEVLVLFLSFQLLVRINVSLSDSI